MNNRFKLIAQQAGLLVHNPEGVPTKLEKFAKLLVLECAPFVGEVTSPAVKEFLQHFGVTNERPN